jgi:hypothetical protein
MCQMSDMLKPAAPGGFTLRDFKRQPKISGLFFNILFNINKFVAYEQRDPFLARQQVRQRTAVQTDSKLPSYSFLDRFAFSSTSPFIHIALAFTLSCSHPQPPTLLIFI